jgi:hypothetical protein
MRRPWPALGRSDTKKNVSGHSLADSLKTAARKLYQLKKCCFVEIQKSDVTEIVLNYWTILCFFYVEDISIII